MPYDMNALMNQIDALRASGNEAQAFAMFNGLSGMGGDLGAGGFAGGLDHALRGRWGDSALTQWVNNSDTKYGNTNFDPKTGQWAGMAQAAGQSGTIAGWDPSQYGGGGTIAPSQYVSGSGAAGGGVGPATSYQNALGSQTGIGVQGDGKTPFGQPMTLPGTRGNMAKPGAADFNALPGRVPQWAQSPGAPPRQPDGAADTRTYTQGGGTPTQQGGGTPTAADYVRAGQPVPPPGGAAGATGAPPPAGGAYVPPPAAAPYTAPTRTAAQQTPFDFMNDAGLQFRLGQGFDKIQGSAAAAGGLQSGATLKALEEFRQGVSSEEYDKAFNKYTNQRDFGEDQFRDDRNFGRGTYEDDRNYGRGVYKDDRDFGESQYQDRRDFGENSRRYEKDFGENSRRYDQDFGENARRYDQDFGERQFQDRRNFDVDEQRYNSDTEYRRSVDDYERRENARRYDQGFDYTARTGDRTFQQQVLDTLSRQGGAAGGMNAEAQATLAKIISQLTTNSGQAGGQGGMGGSQNWLDLIASIFGQGAKRTP